MKKIIAPAIWVLIWHIASVIIDNEIFIPGPVTVLKRLLDFSITFEFWNDIGGSIIRILGGFIIAFTSAYLLAFASFKCKYIHELFYPLIVTLRAVPVAAVVVIISIIAGSGLVTFYVTFMIIFPVVYINIYEGLLKLDMKIIEMSRLYRISFIKKYRYICVPGIMPSLISAVKTGIGLAFKSGVAAEVICQAKNSIGHGIYINKVYLDTPGVLAYTIVVVLLSFVIEQMTVYLINNVQNLKYHKKSITNPRNNNENMVEDIESKWAACDNRVKISGICKSYEGLQVIDNLDISFENKDNIILYADSGKGKTTLLRILAGLEKSDKQEKKEGENGIVSMLFQEDRLLDNYTVSENLNIVKHKFSDAELSKLLYMLGLENVYDKLVCELSGGMRRRVALLKALIYESDLLLLDEPYAGLDESNQEKVINMILLLKNNRPIIISGHSTRYSDILNAKIIDLNN